MTDEVAARMLIQKEIAERNKEAVNERFAPHTARLSRKATMILKSPKPKAMKFYDLWDLVDEINSFNGDNVACKTGCAHCCHVAVAMTFEEAKAVGGRIGRKPREATLRDNFDNFDYGYHNPCVFLKDNLCSIYEHRPLACRLYCSLDVDSLMCQFGDEPRLVPSFDRMGLNWIALCIAAPPRKKCLGDIREFFPNALKEVAK